MYRLQPTSKDVLMHLSKPIGELKMIQNGKEDFKYTRANGKRFSPIAIKVSWDDTVQQAEGTCISFETRSAYRRLCRGSDEAKDKKIFEMAKFQEERYRQWEQGQKEETVGSLSEQWTTLSTPQAFTSPVSTPALHPRSKPAEPVKTVEQWLRDYALVSGWDPKALTKEQKLEAASMLPLEVSRSRE
ncbi:MAG: hypothetical protein OHK93_005886 [Ramalina farinacea]|uniref:Uncharacterized protein n=1 Tax=Ramalina farinacea TaxID=258253 RepID=A0AA43QJ80_9LECA|nr:hypothetical protein [Ramalina farinacea]